MSDNGEGGGPVFPRGLRRQLNVPSLTAGVAVGFLALLYGSQELELPGTLRGSVIGFTAGLVVVLAAIGHTWLRKGMWALSALDETPEPSSSLLIEAIRQARSYPDRAAWVHGVMWTVGGATLGLWMLVVKNSSPSHALGPVLVAFAFGPLSALIAHLVVLERSRQVALTLLEAGRLTPEDTRKALPNTRRQLRRRLVIFTALCALPPTLLMTELVLSETSRALTALETAEGEAAAAVLDAMTRRWVVAALTLSIGAVAIALGAALLAGRSVRRPLELLTASLDRMAAGDLRRPRVVLAEDEIWEASAAVGKIQVHFADALRQLGQAGSGLASTTGEMAQAAGQHEMGAAQQAASLVNTVATTEELARSAAQIAESASSVAGLAQSTFRSAEQGKRASETFVLAMERTKGENQAIADAVVRLNKRVQQIGKIVEFINGVADKSDLLALNAELEGTKAGEVGRGFSLVAAEMRRLAETVLSSTREIAKLIEEVRDATHSAVMATEAGMKATDQGAQLALQVSGRLEAIVKIADQTSDAVRAISLSTQQQQTGTDQLAEAMTAVLSGTDAEARATHEAAAANADLLQLAQELAKAVDQFQLSMAAEDGR